MNQLLPPSEPMITLKKENAELKATIEFLQACIYGNRKGLATPDYFLCHVFVKPEDVEIVNRRLPDRTTYEPSSINSSCYKGTVNFPRDYFIGLVTKAHAWDNHVKLEMEKANNDRTE